MADFPAHLAVAPLAATLLAEVVSHPDVTDVSAGPAYCKISTCVSQDDCVKGKAVLGVRPD